MPVAPPFKFRLTFFARSPLTFNVSTLDAVADVASGEPLRLVARDADVLAQAKAFHIEQTGFDDIASATSAGESVRLRLRFLNALLGLGLMVPTSETSGGSWADVAKEDVARASGQILVDSVIGLSVLPDDGLHHEQVVSIAAENTPADPTFVLKELAKLLAVPMTLNQASEDALNLLGLGQREASDRAAFMVNFLALEPLVPRVARSAAAQSLITEIVSLVAAGPLEDDERLPLVSAIESLGQAGFPAALRALARRIKTDVLFGGLPVGEFVKACVKARNQIAHNAELDATLDLRVLNAGLRSFVLHFIWMQNGIGNISIAVPPSQVSIPAGALAIRYR
jgi:hypothetical protein